MRYAISVQYVGKNYSGSQIQLEGGKPIDAPTIQGELEKALCTLILGKRYTEQNSENASQYNRPIRAIFSGRTDKGVNVPCMSFASKKALPVSSNQEFPIKSCCFKVSLFYK